MPSLFSTSIALALRLPLVSSPHPPRLRSIQSRSRSLPLLSLSFIRLTPHVPLRASPFPCHALSLPLNPLSYPLTSSGLDESTRFARGVRQTSALVGLDPQSALDAASRSLRFTNIRHPGSPYVRPGPASVVARYLRITAARDSPYCGSFAPSAWDALDQRISARRPCLVFTT